MKNDWSAIPCPDWDFLKEKGYDETNKMYKMKGKDGEEWMLYCFTKFVKKNYRKKKIFRVTQAKRFGAHSIKKLKKLTRYSDSMEMDVSILD